MFNKLDGKVVVLKIVLFACVLTLLFAYSRNDINSQQFSLKEAAFLYEGNQLIGVSTGERADQLTQAQQASAQQAAKKVNKTVDQAMLSTKVVEAPTLINFAVSDKEQAKTIAEAKQQTKVIEQGYTITIDGKYKYYVKNKSAISYTAEKILSAYLPDSSYVDYYKTIGKFKPYTKANKTYTDLSINNDIKITEGYTTGSKFIENQDDLLFELFHKNQDKEYDYISDTTSIKSIKLDNKMSDTVLKLDNPTLTDNTVTYDGQKVITNDINPIINVVQTYNTVKKKSIDYETVEEVDDSLQPWEVEVATEGKAGTREITYENKMVNGKLVSTEKLSEKVTKAPVNKVIKVGKKVSATGVSGDFENPTTESNSNAAATASGFIWPGTENSVTCSFGCYAGHTGIDIQSYFGAPEYAAKAGVVVTSGWSNYGYGYYVVIDHGGGIRTLYAHQPAQPPVSVGQYVEQGQVVGYEGQTGHASGEHLHFEIQINGTAVNPYPYIS